VSEVTIPAAVTPSAAARIRIRGAREHNLKNLDIEIPRDRLVVITGLSGSGKSSLAFDTLYAEGQRRYVESLSAYARQFLEQMAKPDVDAIEGLSPAIAIEQKTVSGNPRSTVGTTTEISDYLRLLFARVGQPHCPSCGRPITSQTVQQITDQILGLDRDTRLQILAPVVRDRKGAFRAELEAQRRQGFVRARIDGEMRDLSEEISLAKGSKHDIDIVVDRLTAKDSLRGRIAESVEAALRIAEGLVRVDVGPGREEWLLSERNACADCGISYPEITPRMFSFNSPHGACPRCSGLGTTGEFDPRRIVPDTSLSLARGAVASWGGRRRPRYYDQLLAALASHYGSARATASCSAPAPRRSPSRWSPAVCSPPSCGAGTGPWASWSGASRVPALPSAKSSRATAASRPARIAKAPVCARKRAA
jgi:excinuclease ABC subunit A